MVKLSALVNQRLGRYTLLEKIGSGGMATVFRAIDNNLHRDVAVKILHNHLADQDGFGERFEREARTIASLNHPNIVQVYDFDIVSLDGETITYMVMRYVTDKTLETLLQEHRSRETMLSIEEVRRIMLDLCAALGYAHAHGMVHRDIKPSNVLIEANGQAVLTDFGIAKLAQASGLTQEGTIVGTPAYMSPEQATGDVIDGRSDLYSLGILLFELLAGRPPFEDDGTVSILLKHIQTPPPRISDVIRGEHVLFDRITSRALAKDPKDRFQTAEEFAIELKALTSDSELLTQVLPPLERSAPAATLKPDRTAAGMTHTLLRTIDTALLRPARQNPLTFVALGIAIVSLLIVARVTQPGSQPVTPTLLPTTDSMVASMTYDSLYGTSTFAPDDAMNMQWQQNDTGTVIRQLTPAGEYAIINNGSNMASTSLFNPALHYDSVDITLDATLTADSGGSTGYGIVFRYQDANNYNVFAIDGVGRFSLWTREDGTWRELRQAGDQWSMEAAVRPRGQHNNLRITIYEDLLTGYVNNQQVVQLTETTFKEGVIGIYTANGDSASTVLVDRYTIARTVDPVSGVASSMTGDLLQPTNELPTLPATPESTPE